MRLMALVLAAVTVFSIAHAQDGFAFKNVSYGVTRSGQPLVAQVDVDFLKFDSARPRVMVIGGLGGSKLSSSQVAEIARASELRSLATFAVIEIGNPEGSANGSSKNSVGGSPLRGYPPKAKAYDDPLNPESIYLWRWIGMLAPDAVIVVEHGEQAAVRVGEPKAGVSLKFVEKLGATSKAENDELAAALVSQAVAEVGLIPAVTLQTTANEPALPLVKKLLEGAKLERSPARVEMLRRFNRSPVQVAEELSGPYGQQLNEVAYIPALALVGRLRLAELTGNKKHTEDVERIVKPYHSGEKNPLAKNVSGSTLSGHLVFGELADRTGDSRYIALDRAAADLGFDKDGKSLAAMPYHAEMSDAVFMGTPILAQAGRLTKDPKYVEMALKHARFMTKLNLRPDGLHQHSPVDPEKSAWGRGNGFVTLGLILTLSELPEQGAAHDEIKTLFVEHLKTMLKHQDELGMWHQVVDHPESYREFTVTCMTTFAITRGLRRGWLDRETYEPVVRRAWPSIKMRIGPNGSLVDVCTGTGKMKSLREYLDRPANFGKDDRGGAMALMVSTELAYAEREEKLKLGE